MANGRPAATRPGPSARKTAPTIPTPGKRGASDELSLHRLSFDMEDEDWVPVALANEEIPAGTIAAFVPAAAAQATANEVPSAPLSKDIVVSTELERSEAVSLDGESGDEVHEVEEEPLPLKMEEELQVIASSEESDDGEVEENEYGTTDPDMIRVLKLLEKAVLIVLHDRRKKKGRKRDFFCLSP